MDGRTRELLYETVCKIDDLLKSFLSRKGYATDSDRWITIGAGKNEWNESTGRHVKIDEHGNIVGGSIPKSAQGKPINQWWKSSSPKSPSEASESKKSSTFGKEKPLKISTYYRGARGGSGGYWGDNILEANPTGAPGEIQLGYPTDKEWKDKTSKTNRTNYVDVTIKAGFKNGDPYNLDFDNIKRISGKTYGLSKILKEKGFEWDGEAWTKEKPKSQGPDNFPQLSGSEKQVNWAESIRAKKLPTLKKYADAAQRNLQKLSSATEGQLQPLFNQYGKEKVMHDLNEKIEEQHKAINRYHNALKESRASWWIDNR